MSKTKTAKSKVGSSIVDVQEHELLNALTLTDPRFKLIDLIKQKFSKRQFLSATENLCLNYNFLSFSKQALDAIKKRPQEKEIYCRYLGSMRTVLASLNMKQDSFYQGQEWTTCKCKNCDHYWNWAIQNQCLVVVQKENHPLQLISWIDLMILLDGIIAETMKRFKNVPEIYEFFHRMYRSIAFYTGNRKSIESIESHVFSTENQTNCLTNSAQIVECLVDWCKKHQLCQNRECLDQIRRKLFDEMFEAFQSKNQNIQCFTAPNHFSNCCTAVTIMASESKNGTKKQKVVHTQLQETSSQISNVAIVKKRPNKKRTAEYMEELSTEEISNESSIANESSTSSNESRASKPPIVANVATNWKELLHHPESKSFDMIRKSFGTLFDKKQNVLELPIPIELSTRHPLYGDVTLYAILWWIDEWDSAFEQPTQRNVMQPEFFVPAVDSENRPIYNSSVQPKRICMFHSIQEISGNGKYTPAATVIGKMFSSLHFSANLIHHGRDNGFEQWKVLGTNIKLGSFFNAKNRVVHYKNYPDFRTVDVQFKGTSIPQITSRDLMAVLCHDECNEYVCNDTIPCKHNIVHEYDLRDFSKEDDEKKLAKKKAEEREERLSSAWGRAIWFEFCDAKEVLYYLSWPGWSETFIKQYMRKLFKRICPEIPLQLSFSYVFPESYFGGNIENVLQLLQYFEFIADRHIIGRIKTTDKNAEIIKLDDANPLFMGSWKLIDLNMRAFQPIRVNQCTLNESYGTILRIPIRKSMLFQIMNENIQFPLSSSQRFKEEDPEDEEPSAFNQFLKENGIENNDDFGLSNLNMNAQTAVVSEEGLNRLMKDFVTDAPKIIQILDKKIKSCKDNMDKKRKEYFGREFRNPGREKKINDDIRDSQFALDQAEFEYFRYCLSKAHYERAQEVFDDGLMLLERELVYWYNDRHQILLQARLAAEANKL